jgi:hexokinase
MIINPNKIILAESKQINRSEYPTELLKLREHDEFKNQMIKGLTSRKNSTLISTIPDLKTQYKNIRNNSPFGIKELKPNLTKLNSKIFCIQQD